MWPFNLFQVSRAKTDLAQVLKENSKKSIHLIEANEVSFSKIGGLPDLPKHCTWPEYKGLPMSFVIQLKFSEINVGSYLEEYPSEGLLYLFYAQDQSTWGFDPTDKGSWKTIFIPNENAVLEIPLLPKNLPDESIFSEKQVAGNMIQTFPCIYDGRLTRYSMSEKLKDEYDEYIRKPFNNYPEHQIGGEAHPQQNPEMNIECHLVSNGVYCGSPEGYKDPRVAELLEQEYDWVLLLQIDSDEDVSMMWGDLGMLYLWIKRDDLINRNFENTWMILQCG